jgi:uncharacterized protein YydD (DUF2326 family)
MLKELKKAAKGGALGQVIGTSAELRPQVVLAQDKVTRLRHRLERFEVVESYKELSAEAAARKTELQAIARRAVSLKETVAYLRQALEGEQVASVVDVQRLYEAVGVELPGAHIKRRFDQVAEFQRSVVANRRAYLSGEIARAEAEIAEGERRSIELDGERTRILTSCAPAERSTISSTSSVCLPRRMRRPLHSMSGSRPPRLSNKNRRSSTSTGPTSNSAWPRICAGRQTTSRRRSC